VVSTLEGGWCVSSLWNITNQFGGDTDQLPFFSGSDPDDVANLFSGVGLTNVSVNRLEKLREFENKNRSISYNIANNPSLFMALGEKWNQSQAPDLNPNRPPMGRL